MRWRSLLLTLTIGGALLAGCGDEPESGAAASEEVASDTPILANSDVWTLDREPREMHEFLGRPLVLNFFAESCAPCVREMPAFNTVFGEVSEKVAFVGVSEDATAEAGRRIVNATGVAYEIVWDADGSTLMSLEAIGLPTTAFIDEAGRVLEVHTGELSADALRARLRDHFDV